MPKDAKKEVAEDRDGSAKTFRPDGCGIPSSHATNHSGKEGLNRYQDLFGSRVELIKRLDG